MENEKTKIKAIKDKLTTPISNAFKKLSENSTVKKYLPYL